MDPANLFDWDSTHSWAMNLMATAGAMLLAAKIRIAWYVGSEKKLALQARQATSRSQISQSPRTTIPTRYQSRAWSIARSVLALAVWVCFSAVLLSGLASDPASPAPRWETSSLLFMLGMLVMSQMGRE